MSDEDRRGVAIMGEEKLYVSFRFLLCFIKGPSIKTSMKKLFYGIFSLLL